MTESDFYKKLGERCKELREQKDITPSQLVRKAGGSRSLLYDFENNGKKISAFRLYQILKVFGLSSVEDLLFPEKKKILQLQFQGTR